MFSPGSAEMPAGQVQCEGVLHPCWLHLGGSEPLSANPGPLLSGCDEGVSLCSSAPGIYNIILWLFNYWSNKKHCGWWIVIVGCVNYKNLPSVREVFWGVIYLYVWCVTTLQGFKRKTPPTILFYGHFRHKLCSVTHLPPLIKNSVKVELIKLCKVLAVLLEFVHLNKSVHPR